MAQNYLDGLEQQAYANSLAQEGSKGQGTWGIGEDAMRKMVLADRDGKDSGRILASAGSMGTI